MGNKKLAFLFLTIGNINQHELWRIFLNNNEHLASVYVHAKHPEKVTDSLLKNNVIPDIIETKWGDYSLVKAMINLLKAALQDRDNYKFIFLSESCVPVKPFKDVYEELTSDGNSYINYNDNSHQWRYTLLQSNKLIKKENWYTASQWCILNRNLSEYAVTTENLYLPLFKTVFAADEHYFISIAKIKNDNELVNRMTTYVKWGNSRSHPNTHNIIDKPTLLRIIQTKALFARKFVNTSNIRTLYLELYNDQPANLNIISIPNKQTSINKSQYGQIKTFIKPKDKQVTKVVLTNPVKTTEQHMANSKGLLTVKHTDRNNIINKYVSVMIVPDDKKYINYGTENKSPEIIHEQNKNPVIKEENNIIDQLNFRTKEADITFGKDTKPFNDLVEEYIRMMNTEKEKELELPEYKFNPQYNIIQQDKTDMNQSVIYSPQSTQMVPKMVVPIKNQMLTAVDNNIKQQPTNPFFKPLTQPQLLSDKFSVVNPNVQLVATTKLGALNSKVQLLSAAPSFKINIPKTVNVPQQNINSIMTVKESIINQTSIKPYDNGNLKIKKPVDLTNIKLNELTENDKLLNKALGEIKINKDKLKKLGTDNNIFNTKQSALIVPNGENPILINEMLKKSGLPPTAAVTKINTFPVVNNHHQNDTISSLNVMQPINQINNYDISDEGPYIYKIESANIDNYQNEVKPRKPSFMKFRKIVARKGNQKNVSTIN